MKPEKKQIWLLTLPAIVLFFALPLKAQVTVGKDSVPHSFSILELATDIEKGGLRLPQFSTGGRESNLTPQLTDSLAEGLTIFNSEANCLEFWNGTKWVSLCDNTTTTTTAITLAQPGSITGATDVCPTGATQTYSAGAVTGATSYSWTLPAGWTSASGTTTATPSITVTPALPSSITLNTSINQYMVGGTISVTANDASGDASPARVLSVTTYNGCCAATVSGGYLKFMCYNLGADESLDPFTYNSINDSTSYDIKGWLFQWGRPADGHQWRSSATTPTLSSSDTPGNALFILSPTIPYDWLNPKNDQLWNAGTETDPQKADNDPCPGGWRVPTSTDWSSIFGGIPTGDIPSSATANTWTWTTVNGGSGYKIGNALYLPAAGYRYYNTGSLGNIGGSGGSYCASTPPNNNTSVYYFGFTSSNVYTASINYRASGRSVRCVAVQ